MSIKGYTKGGQIWIPRFIESIDMERCIGCGRCYKVCGREVFKLIEKPFEDEDEFGDNMGNSVMSIANPDNCIGCEACSRTCVRRCHVHAGGG